MNNAAQKYLQTQVTTTTSADVLIMLYDGAIKFLKRAKLKIQEGDVKEKGILIAKALDIINELQCSLNKEKGGQLAENLNNLYFYCNAQLLMANLKKDVAIIDKVVGILGELRSAFLEVKSMVPGSEPQNLGRAPVASARKPMPNMANPAMPNMANPAMPNMTNPAMPHVVMPSPGQAGPSTPNVQPQAAPAPQPNQPLQKAAAPIQQAQKTQPGGDSKPAPQEAPQPLTQQPVQQVSKPATVRNIRSQRGMAAYMNS